MKPLINQGFGSRVGSIHPFGYFPFQSLARHFTEFINEHSLDIIPAAKCEPGLADPEAGGRYQFLRLGYFAVDPDTTPEKPVFNRTVTLRDSWAKAQKK